MKVLIQQTYPGNNYLYKNVIVYSNETKEHLPVSKCKSIAIILSAAADP